MKGEITMEENLTPTQEQEPSPAPAPAPAPDPAPAPAPSPKRNRLPIIIVAAVVAIVAIGAIAFGVARQNAAKEHAEYVQKLNDAHYSMLDGAAKMEKAANLTSSVWYNAIYEKRDTETDPYTLNAIGKFVDDFNDALEALWGSDKFNAILKDIDANEVVVDDLIDGIRNPPDDLEKVYDEMLELYATYGTFMDLATAPSGSYDTYHQNVSSTDSKFMEQYNKVKALLPSEE